jgi:tetratricopeptide (TPR) repeat protein
MSLLEDDVPIGPILSKYLVEYLSKHPRLIPTSEKISVSILVIGLILYLLKIENTGFVLITGSVLTALTYFLSVFQSVETEETETTGILNSAGIINFIYKLYYLNLCLTAIITLGVVIKTFPFLKMLTTICIIFLSIVFIISIITKINDRSRIYNSAFYIRIVPAILLLIYLFTIHYKPNLNADEYFNSGLAKFKVSHYDVTILEDFNKAIKIDPKNAQAYFYRGLYKRYNRDYDGGLADIDRAISLNPLYTEAYLERGMIKYYSYDNAGAIADLTKAEVNADSKFPYGERADAKYHLGDYKGAIEDYDKEGWRMSAGRLINKGYAKSKLGDLNGAIADLSEAIKADPNYANAKIYSELGNFKINTGDYDGAKTDFWRVIQLDPKNAEAYYGRGTSKYKLGDKKGACQDWRKAFELGYEEANESIKKYCK